jgi:hypothetical protein
VEKPNIPAPFSCPPYATILSVLLLFSNLYSLPSLSLGLSCYSSSIQSYFSITAPLFLFNSLQRDTSHTMSSSCTVASNDPNSLSGFRNCYSPAIVSPAERALGISGSMVNACCQRKNAHSGTIQPMPQTWGFPSLLRQEDCSLEIISGERLSTGPSERNGRERIRYLREGQGGTRKDYS